MTKDLLEKTEKRLGEEMGKRDRGLDSLEARGAGAALH